MYEEELVEIEKIKRSIYKPVKQKMFARAIRPGKVKVFTKEEIEGLNRSFNNLTNWRN